jgi:hypothetical protein
VFLQYFLSPYVSFVVLSANRLVNLPVGAVALFVITFFFKMPKSADHKPTDMPLRQRIGQFDPWWVFIRRLFSLSATLHGDMTRI